MGIFGALATSIKLSGTTTVLEPLSSEQEVVLSRFLHLAHPGGEKMYILNSLPGDASALSQSRLCHRGRWIHRAPTQPWRAGVWGTLNPASSVGPHLAALAPVSPPCIFRFSKQPSSKGADPQSSHRTPSLSFPSPYFLLSQAQLKLQGRSNQREAPVWEQGLPLTAPEGIPFLSRTPQSLSFLPLHLSSHSPGSVSSLENIAWG